MLADGRETTTDHEEPARQTRRYIGASDLVRFIGLLNALFHIHWWKSLLQTKWWWLPSANFGVIHFLPSGTTVTAKHYYVLLSSVCENDMLRTGQVRCATDRMILPGIMQLPRIRAIRHGLGNAWLSFWHSRLSFQQILVFSSCRSSQSEVRSSDKTVGYARRSFFVTFRKDFCGWIC
jgi:hypothetical protein